MGKLRFGFLGWRLFAVLTAGSCCNFFNETHPHYLKMVLVINAVILPRDTEMWATHQRPPIARPAAVRHASHLWQPRNYAQFGRQYSPGFEEHDLCIITLGHPARGIQQWPGAQISLHSDNFSCSLHLLTLLAHWLNFPPDYMQAL